MSTDPDGMEVRLADEKSYKNNYDKIRQGLPKAERGQLSSTKNKDGSYTIHTTGVTKSSSNLLKGLSAAEGRKEVFNIRSVGGNDRVFPVGPTGPSAKASDPLLAGFEGLTEVPNKVTLDGKGKGIMNVAKIEETPPEERSKTSIFPIDIFTGFSGKATAITIFHELLGHGLRFVQGKTYMHDEKGVNKAIGKIQNETGANYDSN